jgi:sulfonate transport system substrate-binding protein
MSPLSLTRLGSLMLMLTVACSNRAPDAHDTPPQSASKAQQTLHVVRPKQLNAMATLELHGGLERQLAPLGFGVEWLEFLAGPQQIEALNAGALDIAATAESPPVFAQAAGSTLVYLATTASNGKLVSLLVAPDSKISSVRDLKGKQVAFQKASIGHYLLVKALEDAGLQLSDVVSVFLPPPDANAALAQGAVDAWFVWEPFVTRAVQNHVGRVLIDGARLRDTQNYFTTTREFAAKHPDVLRIFLEQLDQEERWCQSHPKEMVEALAPKLLIDTPTLLEMHSKTEFGLFGISPRDVQRQQAVANLWQRLGLLPQALDVRPGFLSPEQYAQLTPAGLPRSDGARADARR